MKPSRGFTLIELMIVVAVVAVLAGLALGAYNKQIRKSRRAEAKQIVSDYALREEKYRSNHTGYTITQSTLLSGGSAQPLNYYTLTLSIPAGTCADSVSTPAVIANSFQISAAAKPGTDQTKDTACTPLVFVSKCGQITKTPAQCW